LTHLGPAILRAGSGWAFASVVVALASAFVRTIVVARFLGPFEIGLWGIALLGLGFMEAVASSGMDTALVAQRGAVEEYLDPAFTIQVTRGFLVSTVLWIGAPALAWAFHDEAAVPVIRAVGLISAIRGFANPAIALAVRGLQFRRVFWWSLPEISSSLALTLALAVIRRDAWALVIGAVAGQAVGTIASYGLVPRTPRMVISGPRMYELLRFGRFVTGSRALMYLSVYLDAAVVGVAMGTQLLGLYQFAARVAEVPVVTFTRAVSQVALPTLSAAQAGADALTRTWRTMLRWIVAVNTATALTIILFGEAVVRTVAGDRWIPAIPLMRILAVAALFRAVVVLTGQLLDGRGRPALTLRLNAVRLVLLVALLPGMAVWGGVQGIAWAVVLASAGAAALAMRFSARLLSSESLDRVSLSG
jgi:PST family polysaccharide transporter/lipopolysaccharide exporter